MRNLIIFNICAIAFWAILGGLFYIGMSKELCRNYESYTAQERAAMKLTPEECGI